MQVLRSNEATRDILALRDRLSARLKPLAIAIGAVISVGLPLTYWVLQRGALEHDRLLLVTAGLFVLSSMTGVALGVLVYLVPVRLVGGMESGIATLVSEQDRLIASSRALYAEATRREREAKELTRIARELTETLDVDDVGRRIVESVRALFEARSSGLYSLEADGSFRAVAWGGIARERYAPGVTFPAGDGVIGWIIEHNAAVASSDVPSDSRFVFSEARRREIEASRTGAVLAVPLRAKAVTIGVLAVADERGRTFPDDEVALLQAFGDQAALAFENARLYERAQQAYAELTEAQDRLVRGETLRAMGELASGAAHHLNNLLAVVLGRVQLALGKEPPPAVARHLAMAERATLEGADVVRRMRGFGEGRPDPASVPVDLNRIADEVVELTRPRWQDDAHVRGVTIEMLVERADIPPVHGQTAPLREVLVNLVLNAIDAMAQGGRITIRTSRDAEWVQCSVTDTGVGMTPEVRRRALEPFFTTKGVKSTGLGLSVNYGILQRLGGELLLDSDEGRGTTASFRLRAAESRPATPPPAIARATVRPLRILVVDDEPEVRAMLADLLVAQGHDVIQAASGGEALQHVDGQRAIDVVLSDLGMPGMTGWDVAREVKARRADLPVVLVTGWGQNPERSPSERALVDLIIEKPVTAGSLRAAVGRVVSAG